jgi:hypothetical protein
MRSFSVLFVALLTLPVAMKADTYTYTYTGHDFTTVHSPYTTGELTLSAPLATNLSFTSPVSSLSFSFSDGVQTITDFNSPVYAFYFQTDGSGAITEWNIFIEAPITSAGIGGLDLSNEFAPYTPLQGDSASLPGGTSSNKSASNSVAGAWTVTDNPAPSTVPEPSSILMIGTGSAGLLSLLRRTRSIK